MAGHGNGNHPNAGNVKASKSRSVHVQRAADADRSSVAAEDALDPAQRLYHKANRHGRELPVEITERCYQPDR
jgi:hypothetical protein